MLYGSTEHSVQSPMLMKPIVKSALISSHSLEEEEKQLE